MIRLAGSACILLLFLLFQAATCTNDSDGQAPAEYLAEAREALAARDFRRAEALAGLAERDSSIRAWAVLTRAQSLEGQGSAAKAAEMYRSIPNDSAASLDARMGLFRISLGGKGTPSEAGASVSELEQALQQAGRAALIDELQYLRAELAERSGDHEVASSLYLGLRRRMPQDRELAARAREALQRLEEHLERTSPQTSVATLIADAGQLLKENEPRLGLQRIEKAKRGMKKDTPGWFEALLLEEQLRRAAGETEEADRLLDLIAAEGDSTNAETALTRSIKNAWNKNADDRTLELLKTFRERFGDRRNSDELRYIEARTRESRGEDQQSSELYRAIAEKGSSLSFRVKSIRQLAWSAFHRGDYLEAAKQFYAGKEITRKALDDATKSVIGKYGDDTTEEGADAARTRVKAVRDLLDDHLHHLFWLGFALSKTDPTDAKASLKSTETSEQLWQSVVDIAPRSYYGTLAAESLGVPPPASGAPKAGCLLEIPAREAAALSSLAAASLRDWGQAEADWFLGKQLSHPERVRVQSALAGGRQLDEQQLRFLLTRADLYMKYGHPEKGVILADSLLKRPAMVKPFAFDLSDCFPTLERLAFPAPYLDLFRQSAERERVPLSLVLAQARTESFFDPDARSPKDARGLLQLLVSTAKLEGMPENGDLFSPELNIALGAKHIATLLKKFDGRPALSASAYNAGAAATERWLEKRRTVNMAAWVESITYPETRDYVKKVLLAKAAYERLLP